MITKQDFLNAKDTINKYYQQCYVEKFPESCKLTGIGLNKGDYVKYIGGSTSKNLIVGNTYRLTGEPFYSRICVINEAGARMYLRQTLFSKKWLVWKQKKFITMAESAM